jgi:predicted DNA-binding WGR domain protein
MRPIYLEKRDPEKNMYRFCAMHINQTIFGDWALIREWGRIGSPGTVLEQWFDTEEDAITTELALLNKKSYFTLWDNSFSKAADIKGPFVAALGIAL